MIKNVFLSYAERIRSSTGKHKFIAFFIKNKNNNCIK